VLAIEDKSCACCTLKQLGIKMIPEYSPEARRRSARMLATHQIRNILWYSELQHGAHLPSRGGGSRADRIR